MMMMKQTQTLAQKSRTVQKHFVDLINHLEDSEVPNFISPSEITDALERFVLWAGNLGALRESTSKLSLEYRLSEAPEIRIQIHRQLDYLLEAIDDVVTIVQERQENHDIPEDDTNTEYFDALDDLQERSSEEIRMNIELISETLKTLFRIAVLVRKTNPDNRFGRAIHSSKFTFPHTFDIDYVREKYPKLKTDEKPWLAERLGKAIARRRQFIKYCRDHRARLALDDENIEAESATTVLQSSKATTLQLEKMQEESSFAVDNYEDDVVSILSTSTTTDVLSTLALPRLVDLSKDGEAFECPICFTLRSIKGERSWRLHAFHDLKPYSCTVGGAECDFLAFQDRDSWFQHELDCHRSQYACSLCEGGLFLEKKNLRSHIQNSHGQFPEHQLQIMEDAGRKPPISIDAQSCPFCDNWSVALQIKEESKSQEIGVQSILIRTDRFKKHVAAHLEQLAIFAIPRATEDDIEDERSSVNSLGSTIADLSEYGTQEEPQMPQEGWLDGRLTDDEDLLNIDEEQDDDRSLPRQHAENTGHPKSTQTGVPMPEALSNDHFQEPLQSPLTEIPAPAKLLPVPEEAPSPPSPLRGPRYIMRERAMREAANRKKQKDKEEAKRRELKEKIRKDVEDAMLKEVEETGVPLSEALSNNHFLEKIHKDVWEALVKQMEETGIPMSEALSNNHSQEPPQSLLTDIPASAVILPVPKEPLSPPSPPGPRQIMQERAMRERAMRERLILEQQQRDKEAAERRRLREEIREDVEDALAKQIEKTRLQQ